MEKLKLDEIPTLSFYRADAIGIQEETRSCYYEPDNFHVQYNDEKEITTLVGKYRSQFMEEDKRVTTVKRDDEDEDDPEKAILWAYFIQRRHGGSKTAAKKEMRELLRKTGRQKFFKGDKVLIKTGDTWAGETGVISGYAGYCGKEPEYWVELEDYERLTGDPIETLVQEHQLKLIEE